MTWEDLVNVLALWSIYLDFSNHADACRGGVTPRKPIEAHGYTRDHDSKLMNSARHRCLP